MKKMYLLALAVSVLMLSACRVYPDYANDFRFPILRGDIDRGQEAFASLGCIQAMSLKVLIYRHTQVCARLQ